MWYKSYAQNPPPLTNSTRPTCKYLAGQLAGNVFKKQSMCFSVLRQPGRLTCAQLYVLFILLGCLGGWGYIKHCMLFALVMPTFFHTR